MSDEGIDNHSKAAAPLLEVRDLCVHFPLRRGFFERDQKPSVLKAVNGVSLRIEKGGALGLVGESGSGKSSLARAMLRLIPASSGKVFLEGLDIFSLNAQKLVALRRRMQMVFQDPYATLNPRMRVRDCLLEPLLAHRVVGGEKEGLARVSELLESVGLSFSYGGRYPHELSGGQRQRVGIARALSLKPDFLILDEPVSALDVSVQAQILNLLRSLRKTLGLTYLVITHDLSVVRNLCPDVAVMFRGEIVERGTMSQVLDHPMHSYTQSLLSSVLSLETPAPRRKNFGF